MNVLEAIRQMSASSGVSLRKVSADIGRAETFLTTSLTRGSVPRIDTLKGIANGFGYALLLVGRGDILDNAGDGVAAVSTMLRRSGLQRREVSRAIGKSPYFLRGVFYRKQRMRADTFASVAAVCGYQLQLVGHGETIVIDPPERG